MVLQTAKPVHMAKIHCLRSRLMLLQDPNDLLSRKTALLHINFLPFRL